MNILLAAYACEPDVGSEPEVGWQMVCELAKVLPSSIVHVVTKANNVTAIERESYPKNIVFHYYAPPRWVTFWKKGGRGIRTYYYLWMIGAVQHIKNKNIDFDIVHHITFVNDWLPSFFFLLGNKKSKFIWGPIGSHDPISYKFLGGFKRKIVETLRISLQLFFRCADPFFYLCKAKADVIVGINDNVSTKLGLDKSQVFIAEPAVGMRRLQVKTNDYRVNSNTFKVVSVGRLLYIKNFELTLFVFAGFISQVEINKKIILQIVGDGEDRSYLESLAISLGIENHVEFTGKVPLSNVQDILGSADVFLFPTLENAGFVILEAMSNGLPVLAMDYGGPQQFVRSNTDKQLVSEGLQYDSIVDELAKKLKDLFSDPALRLELGRRNRQDVLDHFTWEAKVLKIKKIYDQLLNEA